MSNAIVVFSGGQDSTTCLYWALAHYNNVVALSFFYGQRHANELESAARIAGLAGVHREVIDVKGLLGGSSPLTNHDIEVDSYESAEALPGGLEKTFVPGRNILFLTLAASKGYSLFNGEPFDLVTGVSQEDYGGYPDCREVFINHMSNALNAGLYLDGARFSIQAPLLHLNKRDTVLMARDLGEECMEALSYSHTCYKGVEYSSKAGELVVGCGECHSCLLRARGFEQAGIEDPVLSRVRRELGL